MGYGRPDGRSISTPEWENIQAGIIDDKVIRTLEQKIKAAKSKADPGKSEMAARYEKKLAELKAFVLKNWVPNEKEILCWLNANADKLRQEFIDAIMAMDEGAVAGKEGSGGLHIDAPE